MHRYTRAHTNNFAHSNLILFIQPAVKHTPTARTPQGGLSGSFDGTYDVYEPSVGVQSRVAVTWNREPGMMPIYYTCQNICLVFNL